jgi:hypothetical protein
MRILSCIVALACCRNAEPRPTGPSSIEIATALASEPLHTRRRFNSSLEEKKRYVEQLVRSKLLFEEAQRQKIDQDPTVLRRFRQMVNDTLIERLRSQITSKSITDAEVEQFYREHLAELDQPARPRVAQIVVGSRKEAEELLAEIAKLSGASTRIEQFGLTAVNKSLDAATRWRRGDLGFVGTRTDGPVAQVVQGAQRLGKVGDLSPVLEGGAGQFTLLCKTGERPALKRSLEEMREYLRMRLVNDRRASVADDLMQKLQGGSAPRIDDATLAKIVAPEGPDQAGEGTGR